MADVWLVKEGGEPTTGENPFRKLPLADCISKLALKESNYLCDSSTTPRFNEHTPNKVRGSRFVVVEVGDTEAEAHGWKTGFYVSPLSANDALKNL